MRITLPARMVYLFLQSVVPTVPGAWLTFAQNPVYRIYDRPYRLWNIGVLDDQQAAGAIMKIFGGFYLWVIIAVLFFRWAGQAERQDGNRYRIVGETDPSPPGPDVPGDAVEPPLVPDDLTYEQLAQEFERLGPAPREPVPGRRDTTTRDADHPDPPT
jgi:putative membrane protein